MRAVSPKRARANRSKPAVREAVFDRYGHRCVLAHLGGCFGHLTPHHRQKSSGQGAYSEPNLVAMCSTHNDLIEADADLAAYCADVGLVISRHAPAPTEPWIPLEGR